MRPHIEVPRVVKFLETEVEWWLSEAVERWNEELVLNGYGVSMREDEKSSVA